MNACKRFLRAAWNEHFQYALGTIVVFVVMVGLGASVAAIYDENQQLVRNSPSGECPAFPSDLHTFTIEKNRWAQWHWTFDIKETDGQVRLLCPTSQYDAGLFLEGRFAGYIDGEMTTLEAHSRIKDCHGDTRYYLETGTSFLAPIEGVATAVSLTLKDKNNEEIVAFVEADEFFSRQIKVYAAANRQLVSRMTLDRLVWTIERFDTAHPGADAVLLSILAARRNVYDANDLNGNRMPDGCNAYFWPVSWVVVGMLSVIGLLVALFGIYSMASCWHKRKARVVHTAIRNRMLI